jgi:hypothetical protein
MRMLIVGTKKKYTIKDLQEITQQFANLILANDPFRIHIEHKPCWKKD